MKLYQQEFNALNDTNWTDDLPVPSHMSHIFVDNNNDDNDEEVSKHIGQPTAAKEREFHDEWLGCDFPESMRPPPGRSSYGVNINGPDLIIPTLSMDPK